SGGALLRVGHRLLRLDRELIHANHIGATPSVSFNLPRSTQTRRAGGCTPALPLPRNRKAGAYFVPLLTATLICFGFASSSFGKVMVSTPFLYSALTPSCLMVFGRVKLRLNVP